MASAPVLDFVSAAIDQLGAVKARIAELKAEEARLAGIVAESGHAAYEGRMFRATVSQVAERKALDSKAAEAKLRELGVDGRWFSKNQKVTKGYTTVKVVARKA